MLAYLWFCVMLRAVSPGADVIITRYNQAMDAFISAGLLGEAPRFGHALGAEERPERAGAERADVHVIKDRLKRAFA